MTDRQPIRPRALGPGARVALVAPAGPLSPERIERSARRCRALGLEPVVFPAAGARSGYLAGTDTQRLADLQAAFDDPEIDAVWALRGGYGTLRIVDGLQLDRQLDDPIPFIGFSDNTTLHARHLAVGVISFHGPHPGGEFPAETSAAFRRVLFSAEPPGLLPTRPGDPPPRTLVGGTAEGHLVGGNLAMLAALCGSRDVVDAKGRILFLEDVGEEAYRVDRMLVQLSRAGVLDGVAGLAFGRFTGRHVEGDQSEDPQRAGARQVEAVIAELAERIGVPAVVDLPFGHVEHNCTLPVGGRAVLDADEATLSLGEPCVEGGVSMHAE